MTVLHKQGLWIALALALGLVGCDRGKTESTPEPSTALAGVAVAGEPDHPEPGHAEGVGHTEHGEPGEEGEASHEGEDEERVVLTPAQRAAAGIVLAPAQPGEIPIRQALPGEVVVNADRLAHIVPRFSGIAREVRKTLGDEVQVGEVLAVIEANESLAPYEVKSLISGTVIEKHVTLGEYVSNEQDIYVVADLSSVWVNVTVYARDLERIRSGQVAVIDAAGISEKAEGRIDYIGPIVGEATRTSIARIVLSNPRRVWRPGLFVTAHVRTDVVPARVLIADEAIQTLRGQSVVFVDDGGGFRTRVVEVGRTDGEWTEIRSGLQPGERVVVENSFVLKSELLKNEAGHGHGH